MSYRFQEEIDHQILNLKKFAKKNEGKLLFDKDVNDIQIKILECQPGFETLEKVEQYIESNYDHIYESEMYLSAKDAFDWEEGDYDGDLVYDEEVEGIEL